MIKRVEEFMMQWSMLPENGRILVGFSGGADSLCLMEILRGLSASHGLTLLAVHVHHGIRGKDADKDAAFVKDYCEKYRIAFEICEVSAKEEAKKYGIGLEEAGRQLRYRLFQTLADSWNAGAIAVAHHQNDQAETMLFQMARGSSLTGAGGIRPVQGQIIRPLLCVNREEIRAFLEQKKLTWREDETNTDTTYTRNRIRCEVMPLLEKINTEAVAHFAALALDLQDTERYLKEQEEPLWQQMVSEKEGYLRLSDALLQQDRLLRQRICYRAIACVTDGRRDLTRDHAAQVDALFDSTCGRTCMLPGKKMAWREADSVCIGIQPVDMEKTACELHLEKICNFKNWQISLTLLPAKPGKIMEKPYTKWVDYDKIKTNLVLRRRQPEDILCIDAAGHHKKLNRFLIDRKIPRYKRDSLWLIADGSQVVWIPGERMGAEYKVTEETKRILEIKITGECEDER